MHITPAERQVIDCVAGDLTYEEAAHYLGKAVQTIKNQMLNARRRNGLASTSRLVAMYASEHGLPPSYKE